MAYGKAAADLLASNDYKTYRTQLAQEKKAARVSSGPFVPAVSQQSFEDKCVCVDATGFADPMAFILTFAS